MPGEGREAKYPCKMMTKLVRPKLSNSPMKTRSRFRRCACRPGGRAVNRVAVRASGSWQRRGRSRGMSMHLAA